MTDRIFNVLFLCTHNSCRSVIAECIMNAVGAGKFKAFSAGSHPSGTINASALALLERMKHPVEGLHSKSWDEFAAQGAPPVDFIFTVCDDAAGETCPFWPGKPMTAHWGVADPSRAEGTEAEKAQAFADTYRMLNQRISTFVNLPVASLDRLTLQARMDDIGRLR
ncbi:MAG: arsenate reductase ArsC [Hyphomicrobium sp.]